MMFFSRRAIVAAGLAATLAGCNKPETFPELGQGFSGPIALARDDGGTNFYVLNTDFERQFNSGSVLVVKEDGTKVNAVPVPRMGRSLTVGGSRMLLTFDKADQNGRNLVWLMDVSTPELPVFKAEFEIDCTPMNAIIRKNYQYFAVTCAGGDLWVGTLAADLSQSTLSRVRSYGRTRRALYLDTKRGLLLAFPTDTAKQVSSDGTYEDKRTFTTDTFIESAGANEIPDEFEKDKRSSRQHRELRSTYQFVVYNVAAEALKGFPYAGDDKTFKAELRWLYYTLTNPQGWPDGNSLDPNVKNYRTNIWEARANPSDPDSFYISHRGYRKSQYANNIVKVAITGDLTNAALPTSQVMTFERVFGFGGEVDDKSFPSDFAITTVDGQELVVINHFRDLVYWKPEERLFAIEAKALGGSFWRTRNYVSDNYTRSYYQLAINQKGRAMTLSYYGNSVFVIDVRPGLDITEVTEVR